MERPSGIPAHRDSFLAGIDPLERRLRLAGKVFFG
jgi:hypothetical protein